MKRLMTSRAAIVVVLILAMMMTTVGGAAAMSSKGLGKASVTIDGTILEASAYIVNGRTLVPMRAIFERLDATVEWNAATRTVTATKGTVVIKLTIDNANATVGNSAVTLSVPPVIIDGKTYVPLRFVSEALGCQVEWDAATRTAKISTSAQDSGQTVVHEGEISAQGETWSPGSMHIVRGDFEVKGDSSPVLTIEAGTVVRFEKGASLVIGRDAPGGLVVEGTAAQPVSLTAAIAGAQPGFWGGVKFYNQSMRDNASISGARIEYAGNQYGGAVYIEGTEQKVEVLVKDTKISGSTGPGLDLYDMGRLQTGSTGNQITGCAYPVRAAAGALGTLEAGNTFSGNKNDWINVPSDTGNEEVRDSATWRNLGIPYKVDSDIAILDNSVVTIEPGVEMIFNQFTGIDVGSSETGSLAAVGAAGKPIKFTGMAKRMGSWDGIRFGYYAGTGNRLEYVVIEYAVTGVNLDVDPGPFIKSSIFRSCQEYAIYRGYDLSVGTSFILGLSNMFEGNVQDENQE